MHQKFVNYEFFFVAGSHVYNKISFSLISILSNNDEKLSSEVEFILQTDQIISNENTLKDIITNLQILSRETHP